MEVSYFALDMAADFMTSRSEGDGCDQTTFSPILFPMYRGGRCRQGCIDNCFLSRHCQYKVTSGFLRS